MSSTVRRWGPSPKATLTPCSSIMPAPRSGGGRWSRWEPRPHASTAGAADVSVASARLCPRSWMSPG
ncbi:hypothetical protein ACFPRL_21700 [Pseudoclavibacter helvolus]